MKTCKQCKDEACWDMGSGGAACPDFTSVAIEEEPVEFVVTPDAYKELKRMYGEACEEITRLEARVRGFENAISSVVRWAQGDEAP